MHNWTHGVARASGCHRAYVAERQIHSRQMWKFPVSGESANRIEGGKKREFGSLARREIIHSDLRDAALHQRRNAVDAARHREDRYELSHVSPRNRIRASSRLRSDSQIRPKPTRVTDIGSRMETPLCGYLCGYLCGLVSGAGFQEKHAATPVAPLRMQPTLPGPGAAANQGTHHNREPISPTTPPTNGGVTLKVSLLRHIQKESAMSVWSRMGWFLAALPTTAVVCLAQAPSVVAEDFPTLVKRLQAEKPMFAKRQQDLLAARYDLADRPARGTAMSRGKPVQDGVRVKLPAGMTW